MYRVTEWQRGGRGLQCSMYLGRPVMVQSTSSRMHMNSAAQSFQGAGNRTTGLPWNVYSFKAHSLHPWQHLRKVDQFLIRR